MVEPSHVLEWDRLTKTYVVGRRYFEIVAVSVLQIVRLLLRFLVLFPLLLSAFLCTSQFLGRALGGLSFQRLFRLDHRFFTGNPGVPRSRTPCAVSCCSGQAEKLLLHLTRLRVVDHVCGPTNLWTDSLPFVEHSFRINFVDEFIEDPKRTTECLIIVQLVVSDEDHAAILAGKGRHPIGASRRPEPIVHGVSSDRYHFVTEPFR